MDPEPRKGSAKPAGHPEPEPETNLQTVTGRRAQDPRRLHPETFTRSAPSTQEKHAQRIRIESGRPAAASNATRRRGNAPRTRKHASRHRTPYRKTNRAKSAYIQLSRCRKAQQKSATGSAAPSFSKIEHHVFIYICIMFICSFHIIVNLQTFFFIIKFF